MGMVIGVGTDILRMSRISQVSLRDGEAFLVKTYSPKEIETANLRSSPHEYFANRFCGKEAVFKALGLPADKVRFSEIEILADETGRPTVTLLGQTGREAAQIGIEKVLISLSYDDDIAIAYALAQTI